MTIFISIAAYRDPELVPTIVDCLAKAKDPDQLRFGICWQHGAGEDFPANFREDRRFRILDVDWRDSKGACWARAEIMGLFQGEDFFLQIDSHHRFAAGWDLKLIDYAASTGSPKPVLTTYCPSYNPSAKTTPLSQPTRMDFDYFTGDGIPMFKPAFISDTQELQRPLRARFLSGHFLFAPGSFVEEVPYNPEIYFHGEEITLTVRAYTCGYDLFHPPEALLWHEYTRNYRSKHWDDHVESAEVELAWHQRDAQSKAQVAGFLAHPQVGLYGCGSTRTVADYEAYAGISFQHRKVREYTREGGEPPNPDAPDTWERSTSSWRVTIKLERSRLAAAALADAQFWYVGMHDEEGIEVFRNDLPGEQLAALARSRLRYIRLEWKFQSSSAPVTWTVWPFSQSEGWLDKISGAVQ